MPTVAHRPARLVGQAPRQLTIWLVAAILVAAVATTLALSLVGFDDQQTAPAADATPSAPRDSAPAAPGRLLQYSVRCRR